MRAIPASLLPGLLLISAVLFAVPSTAQVLPLNPPCTGGGPFGFEVGVYLPPGAPTVHLVVTDLDNGSTLWQGDLQTTATVSGPSGCHWAAHVGELAPPDPLRASLPANRPLRFDFGPFHPFFDSFEYQFCRGAGAPFGTFQCPQDPATAAGDSTHVVFVYSSSIGGEEGMRVLVPSVMQGGSGSFDDLVSGIGWVLPYDLEQACGRNCGTAPSFAQTCNAEVAERETPYLRRIIKGSSSPGLTVNAGAPWVIRAGRDVTWDEGDFPTQTPLLAFQGSACVEVRGTLEVHGVSMTANEPFTPWRGVSVEAGGFLRIESAAVSHAGDRYAAAIPGAVRTYGGEIVLDGAALLDNFASGLYVAGAGGKATVRGESQILRSRIPNDVNARVPGAAVAAGGELLIIEVSEIRENQGPGIRASGYGTYAFLDSALVQLNLGPGVEALDEAEVFFARMDDSGNPLGASQILDNVGGGITSEGGASLVAGISDGVICRRFCNNTIVRNADAGAFDARAVTGGVIYAEANFWGFDVQDVSELVLIEDASSFLSVEPILTSPPTLAGSGTGARGTGAASRFGAARSGEAANRSGVRDLVAAARARAALGDEPGAFADLLVAFPMANTEEERRLAFTSAAALLARAQPAALLAWLEAHAEGNSLRRPWALRALAVAYAASEQPVNAAATAWILAADYPGSEHALDALVLRVRLAVEAADEGRAITAFEELAEAFPEAEATDHTAALVLAAFPWLDVAEARVAGRDAEAASSTDADAGQGAVGDILRRLSVWPNPLAEEAEIGFALGASARVRLSVYDVLGRRVAVLADGYYLAGQHRLHFDGRGLPAGVYLIRAVVTEDAAVQALTHRVTVLAR